MTSELESGSRARDRCRRTVRLSSGAAGVAAALLVCSARLLSQDVKYDIVLVIDTSVSMAKRDPDRRALLVTNLLSDLTPGSFAVVRLRSLGSEIPTVEKPNAAQSPCVDDPTKSCREVSLGPTAVQDAHNQQPGVIVRDAQGSTAFRSKLEAHLVPSAMNSLFDIAFEEAQGNFERRTAGADTRRVLVWLSDGETEGNVDAAARKIRDVAQSGVRLEALLFGDDAKTELSTKAGLTPRPVKTAGDLMPEFARVFQTLVGAAHTVHGVIAENPQFEIKPGVDEAWVVAYGDQTLASAEVAGPRQRHAADYAAYNHPTAGAYRVAHLTAPEPGSYRLSVSGGGAGVAFAVIQTAALRPFLTSPAQASLDTPTPFVVELRGRDGRAIPKSDLPPNVRVSLQSGSDTVEGQPQADGTFVGRFTFRTMGQVAVRARAWSDVLDKAEDSSVQVSGMFRYRGGPRRLDFGTLGISTTVCRDVAIDAEQIGNVALSLEVPDALPSDLRLRVRLPRNPEAAGAPVVVPPGESVEVCLDTGPRAPSSSAAGRRATLTATQYAGQNVPLELTWKVTGLTWWQRYRALVLGLLGLILVVWIILGFYLPQRWPRGMSLTFAPTLRDLEEQRPVPIKTWKGTGIGFYRDARTFLHPDFRLSGKRTGAVMTLTARRHGIKVQGLGTTLTLNEGPRRWEPFDPELRQMGPGDTIRAGTDGPYVRFHVEGQ